MYIRTSYRRDEARGSLLKARWLLSELVGSLCRHIHNYNGHKTKKKELKEKKIQKLVVVVGQSHMCRPRALSLVCGHLRTHTLFHLIFHWETLNSVFTRIKSSLPCLWADGTKCNIQ